MPQGRTGLIVAYASLLIWLLGFAIPVVVHLSTGYSRGETGLIEMAALFGLGTVIVAVASALGTVVAGATCVLSPGSRRVAGVGLVVNVLTLSISASAAFSVARNFGTPLGCKKVGPDIQIGPDSNIQSGDEVSTQFGGLQLGQLHRYLDSPEFRTELVKRVCPEMTSPFSTSVRLLKEGDCQARMVGYSISPPQNAPCFEETYRYLFQQAVRKLDPSSPSPTVVRLLSWPEPTCSCSSHQ